MLPPDLLERKIKKVIGERLDHMKESKSGVRYDIRMEINDKWGFYDRTVAECHLNNYGKIFIDEYGCPIDNEYILQDIEEIEKER